jgi:protease-4
MSYEQTPQQVPVETATQPPRRSGRTGCIVALVVLGCLALFGMALIFIVAAAGGGGSGGAFSAHGDKVALVRVAGIIVNGGGEGPSLFPGGLGSEGIIKHLRKARKDPSVKAIVIRINSPGGSAAASDEIFQEIMRAREDEKPIIASMADTAASGGYYVASACDEIIASKATLTGSIGVIIGTLEYHEGLAKLGVRMSSITSGPFKDMGAGDRPMRDEERKLFEGMVMDVHEQFIEAVAQGRKMDKEAVRELADGRAYTGRQAHEKGLVDELGTMRDAVVRAAELAGMDTEDPLVEEYGKVSLLELLTGSYDTMGTEQALAQTALTRTLSQSGCLLLAPSAMPMMSAE